MRERVQHYDRLDATAVLATVERLQRRIAARFPERNLSRVAEELQAVVADVTERAESPDLLLRWLRVASRVAVAGLVVLTGLVVVVLVRDLQRAPDEVDALDWVQGLEAGINDVVFAGIAVGFLWLVPSRMERSRALQVLYRLRSLAHIIDMHQLTKDPERLNADFRRTPASVDTRMTAIDMANYLDYCSEMLSLVGKAAALFGDRTTDSAVLDTVSDVESLTDNMSTKIWQKVALLPLDDSWRRPGPIPGPAS
ncbi:MAG TPA: hypothetical protein VKY71_01245 [Actinotalea caeni]|uniref:hypothetical protein n=2 Tax=Actinotalea caeni TaxID=1348467 RepID=UPI002B4ABD66|nr:hypothetical protein [Actinotalea caeni]HLV54180.1 hypothetical protein [Actinotalea caeni]